MPIKGHLCLLQEQQPLTLNIYLLTTQPRSKNLSIIQFKFKTLILFKKSIYFHGNVPDDLLLTQENHACWSFNKRTSK